MGLKEKVADEVRVTTEGIVLTAGKFRFCALLYGKTITDLNTALTASETTYIPLFIAPKAMTLVSATLRTAANGVASGTIDILKAASGTAITSGTAMVTQVTGNGFTADTNRKVTINTDGTQIVASGALVFAKVVTQAVETLKPVVLDMEFSL